MDREHRMYLLSADLREVHARLSLKFRAGMAEKEMHLIRNEDQSGSIPDASPNDLEEAV